MIFASLPDLLAPSVEKPDAVFSDPEAASVIATCAVWENRLRAPVYGTCAATSRRPARLEVVTLVEDRGDAIRTRNTANSTAKVSAKRRGVNVSWVPRLCQEMLIR